MEYRSASPSARVEHISLILQASGDGGSNSACESSFNSIYCRSRTSPHPLTYCISTTRNAITRFETSIVCRHTAMFVRRTPPTSTDNSEQLGWKEPEPITVDSLLRAALAATEGDR